MNRVVVGLGGNTTGTRDAFRRAGAVLELLLHSAVRSSLYRTEPQEDTDQESFWNAAVTGLWPGSPLGLLERLLMLEARLGRVRDQLRPKGPRLLDLDLLLFGEQRMSTPRLTLPHPGLPFRRFALEPLVEVWPEATDPRDGSVWAQTLNSLPPQGVDPTALPW